MRFIHIRTALVGLTLLTFVGTQTTLAKQPIRSQGAKLIAQASTAAPDFATASPTLTVTPDSNAIISTPSLDVSESATQTKIDNFLSTAASGSTITIPLPVEGYLYSNGGIADAGGIKDVSLFKSYFKKLEATNSNLDDYAILGASDDAVAVGPLTATATIFSPNLDPTRVKSARLQFDYAFEDPSKADTLKVIIRGESGSFSQNLPTTSGKSVNLDVTKAFTGTVLGTYKGLFSLVKPGVTSNDAAGIVNINLIITKV